MAAIRMAAEGVLPFEETTGQSAVYAARCSYR
jgi:hypothetical protein